MEKNVGIRRVCLVKGDGEDVSGIRQILDAWDVNVIQYHFNSDEISYCSPDVFVVYVAGENRELLASFCKSLRVLEAAASIPTICIVPNRADERYMGQVLENMMQVTWVVGDRPRHEIKAAIENVLSPDIGITFWGVRGSTPCANKENMEFGGNTTCVQIEVPGSNEVLILDSGTGIRNAGNQLVLQDKEITGRIFITHPHWDHIQGFPFFKPIYNHDNQFFIHMPEQVNGGCEEILSGHLTKTFFPVTLGMIDANIEYVTQPEERQHYHNYEVEYMLANHPINTAIYKIHIGNKQIVFCPDNELTPITEKTNAFFYKKLKHFLSGIDVLIHDAQYNHSIYKSRVGWGHSAWEEAVDFAIRSGVKHLYLTHHDPDSDDAYLEVLDEKLQRDFSPCFESIQLAREGIHFNLT